ncbi:MAG: hypothetical protein ACREL3_10960 [Gemmatimonadales bacterium]
MAHISEVRPSLAVVAALAVACGRSEEPGHGGAKIGASDSAAVTASAASSAERRVSNVMIGRRVGPTNRITEPTFQFAPRDTVRVSVGTEGARGAGTLSAAWRSPSGEILQQTSEPVGAAGENTVLQLSQPNGLKPGTYKVIVFLGDDSVDTKVFVVQK